MKGDGGRRVLVVGDRGDEGTGTLVDDLAVEDVTTSIGETHRVDHIGRAGRALVVTVIVTTWVFTVRSP